MPGFLFHVGAVTICPHGGQVATSATNARVLVSGQPVATLGDTFLVAGCPFTMPEGRPQPCIKVQWLGPATRVLINGWPAILQTSTGLCLSPEQIQQGPAIVTMTQLRVAGL